MKNAKEISLRFLFIFVEDFRNANHIFLALTSMKWYIANQVSWLIPGLILSDCDLPLRRRLATSNNEQPLLSS